MAIGLYNKFIHMKTFLIKPFAVPYTVESESMNQDLFETYLLLS